MNDNEKQPSRTEIRSGNEQPHNISKPEPTVEGHKAAVRSTSITPGEAGSRNTDGLVGEGLTERLDTYDEYEEGVEGRLGGETSGRSEDVVGGSDMDEFDEEGTPRRGDPDW